MSANVSYGLSTRDGSPQHLAVAPIGLPAMSEGRAGGTDICDGVPNVAQYSFASEEYLLSAAQRGDQQAFVELCGRHRGLVKKKIFSIVRNEEDAEDALQETFLRAFVHLEGFRRTCKFSTWITTIGINSALMTLRKRKSRREVQAEIVNADGEAMELAEYADRSPSPEERHSKRQMALLVLQDIERLQPHLRAAITVFYSSECSLEELATTLNLTVATVKSRLLRGRKRLRWYLQRRGITSSRA
jgi:RNA polymerase sigma-70 factor (ECF subfamily)